VAKHVQLKDIEVIVMACHQLTLREDDLIVCEYTCIMCIIIMTMMADV